ncbi:2-dehydropantoate 2-reductase [Paraliobacillus ryukyuensis]|uniref:2-dehydropantoate 2-reductase n=1 Tax=Paraliobacillus ryukyuensis TaxID=200904 RepID=UPI0009A74880|nr:2-dehydropantoate 2-reductase [Paraliobacillus ryukyuensis]
MKIGIIGGGAIGLLLTSMLEQSNHQITLYVRREKQKQQINREGITVMPRQTKHLVQAETIDNITQMELYIVCVKQYHLADIMDKLRSYNGATLYLQNGMSHVDSLLKGNDKQTILLGTCEHGARRESDHMVTHTGDGTLNIALLKGKKNTFLHVIDTLQQTSSPIVINENWNEVLINKLIINAVINPITALFQVKNGALLSNSYLYSLTKAVCKEVCTVLEEKEENHWPRILDIIDRTKANDSSMKVDINKYQRTEIDGILGYILDHATQQVSYVRFLYLSIKALEEKGSN